MKNLLRHIRNYEYFDDLLPDSVGLEEILKQADNHLYEAKQRDRNRVIARVPDLHENGREPF